MTKMTFDIIGKCHNEVSPFRLIIPETELKVYEGIYIKRATIYSE